MFLMQHSDKFAATDLPKVRAAVEQLPDSEFTRLATMDLRNPTITLVLALVLGAYGVGAFYVKKIGFGVAQIAIFAAYMFLAIGMGVLSGLAETEADVLVALIVVMVLFFGLLAAMLLMVIISAVKARQWTREYNIQKFNETVRM